MRHPSYLLNPGDLFQVEPDRVMYATGAPKTAFERRESRQLKQKSDDAEAEAETKPEATEKDEGERSRLPAGVDVPSQDHHVNR